MKVRIKATAPTFYQIPSLNHFCMGCYANGNGSYSASMTFDTMKEAKEYLANRAEYYFEDEKSLLKKAKRDIRMYGVLRLDEVSASLEKIATK
jgi:hypothetical protein